MRIILIQVPDTQTEDDIDMAIQQWNAVESELGGDKDRTIHYTKTSLVAQTSEQIRA